MAEKWIAGAIRHPGALTRKAKAAGQSVPEFCAKKHDDATTQRQCSLAKTLRGMSKKG